MICLLVEALVRRVKEGNEQVLDKKSFILGHLVQIGIFLSSNGRVVASVGTDEPEDRSLIVVLNDLESSVVKACHLLRSISEDFDGLVCVIDDLNFEGFVFLNSLMELFDIKVRHL